MLSWSKDTEVLISEQHIVNAINVETYSGLSLGKAVKKKVLKKLTEFGSNVARNY